MTNRYVRHSSQGFFIWPADSEVSFGDFRQMLDYSDGQVTSAGFFHAGISGVSCFGRSEELGLGPDGDDPEELEDFLGLTSD